MPRSASDTAHDNAAATDTYDTHPCAARVRARFRRAPFQPRMRAMTVVQGDNPTPIVPRREKSGTPGIRGSVVLSSVYETRVKHEHSVCWCGLEEERHRRAIEIPSWMFEPAACG